MKLNHQVCQYHVTELSLCEANKHDWHYITREYLASICKPNEDYYFLWGTAPCIYLESMIFMQDTCFQLLPCEMHSICSNLRSFLVDIVKCCYRNRFNFPFYKISWFLALYDCYYHKIILTSSSFWIIQLMMQVSYM